ncbi:MAG TPA: sugar phosphate isomerase/epimerase [Clostridiaceae bacterium]|nr:sugar phosphate isomerase/epimerase [Clostridiaceae bacterium]
MNINLAVQLYSVRDEANRDFVGTLEKVAKIGYKGVEFAGYGGLTASQMKKHLDRLGLRVAGSHVGIDDLLNNLDDVIKYNIEIGNKYIVCPYASFKSKQDIIDLAQKLNRIGKKCKENGLQLCYHNHNHEFNVYDGETGLDIIYKETDPDLVKAEFDVYWIKYAGVDPVSYIHKHKDVCELIHLKDMAKEDKFYTEIGNGIIDFGPIIKESLNNGAKWFVVEQDECRRPPLESIKISYDNIKKMHDLK